MKAAALLALLLAAPRAFAHRVDDLLQAALVDVTATNACVQLNLNPGVVVAEKLIWLIDRNRDGKISADEERRFAEMVMRQLEVSLDEKSLATSLVSTRFDSIEELKDGNGNVRIELRAMFQKPISNTHHIRFVNRNFPEFSSYLVNAILPKSAGIEIQRQERNENQSVGRIEFAITPPK